MSTPAQTSRTGKFEMLTIRHETKLRGRFDGKVIEAAFNPNQLRYDNRAEWRAAGTVAQSIAGGYQRMEFQATPPATLVIELFFDTYEGGTKSGEGSLLETLRPALAVASAYGAEAASAVDVTQYTSAVAKLAHVQSELHRPPVCQLQWGKTKLFTGVLTQLRQDLTFFMHDGTPVRATLGCTFMAYRTFDTAASQTELHSADVAKRRVVRRGDTLTSIAFDEYNDPERWRDIARENNIDNPRSLTPGQALVIPKVEG